MLMRGAACLPALAGYSSPFGEAMSLTTVRRGTSLRCFLLLLPLLGTPALVHAQDPDPSVPVETAANRRAAVQDTVYPSARTALIRSLVLPGWGQTYVGAHGRGAFYFALETGSLWMVYRTSRALAAARDRERELREIGALGANEPLALAESRAQQVEDWITLSIFWALFAGADAYVSAQLADFAGHVGVAPDRGGGVRFQVRFDAGPRR